MGRARLLVLALGIPGLLLYGALATAQWRGNAALAEFNRLQKEHPSDSMETEDPKIAARKRAALALAARFIPDQSEPAYQAALQSLVLAESESLHSSGPPQPLGSGLDAKVTVLLRESLRSVNRAIALNPGDAEYHFMKATALQNLQAGLPGPEAVTAEDAVTSLLTTADRLNPYAPTLHYRIGSFQMALGNLEEAKRAFSVALTDIDRYARPVFDLLWSSVGDVGDLGQLVGEEPLARALLGEFLWNHGYKGEAEKEFEFVLAKSPLVPHAAELLVQHYFRTDRFSEARDLLTRMEKQTESLSTEHLSRLKYFRGMSFLLENRYQEAVASFEESVSLDQYIYYVHEALGQTYFKMGAYDQAIARFRFILGRTEATIAPDWAAALHVQLGQVYERKQEFLEALAEYSKASHLDPDNKEALRRAEEVSRSHL